MKGYRMVAQSSHQRSDRSDEEARTDPEELKPFVWENDTIVVNGQQVTVMFPPEIEE